MLAPKGRLQRFLQASPGGEPVGRPHHSSEITLQVLLVQAPVTGGVCE